MKIGPRREPMGWGGLGILLGLILWGWLGVVGAVHVIARIVEWVRA